MIYSRERGLSPSGALIRGMVQELVRARVASGTWPNAALA
jgi:hypothetical protein